MFNVSMGGCAVQCPVAVSDGMLVSLRIFSSRGDVPINIEMARVRWATTNEFGVQFLMVLSHEREKLEQFLHAAASHAVATDASPSQAA